MILDETNKVKDRYSYAGNEQGNLEHESDLPGTCTTCTSKFDEKWGLFMGISVKGGVIENCQIFIYVI